MPVQWQFSAFSASFPVTAMTARRDSIHMYVDVGGEHGRGIARSAGSEKRMGVPEKRKGRSLPEFSGRPFAITRDACSPKDGSSARKTGILDLRQLHRRAFDGLTFVLTKSLVSGTTDVNARDGASRSRPRRRLFMPVLLDRVRPGFSLSAAARARPVSQAIEPMAILIRNPGRPG
ncbi:hypothetical protein GCM10027176_11470 [Actinoallomurus bryophytorum]|uniref:hypothetical protein n=1 Tax=Actinoallomurus bryophytorum TaxID=1490222 RepID=UPI0011530D63|nr:hypothetical protein [Actinoallomurus bryophytorum]